MSHRCPIITPPAHSPRHSGGFSRGQMKPGTPESQVAAPVSCGEHRKLPPEWPHVTQSHSQKVTVNVEPRLGELRGGPGSIHHLAPWQEAARSNCHLRSHLLKALLLRNKASSGHLCSAVSQRAAPTRETRCNGLTYSCEVAGAVT